MDHGEILRDMTFLIENYGSEYYNKEDLRSLLFECVNSLLELSVSHGFEGNLWHTYLTFLLVNDENAYSTSCEIVGEVDGSINQIALHDFAIFKELFDYDFTVLEKGLEAECIQVLMDYKNVTGGGKVFNRRIKDRICDLSRKLGSAADAAEFKKAMTQFYREFAWESWDSTRRSAWNTRSMGTWRSFRSPTLHTCTSTTWSGMRSRRRS